MWDELFVAVLAGFLFILLRWAFKALPQEEWQILACVPTEKDDTGSWKGVNLTTYGLFVSSAVVTATALILVLMGAMGVPPLVTAIMLVLMLIVCGPAAKIVARSVEKKRHTLTIGGASFLGIVVAPGVVWVTGAVSEWLLLPPPPMVPTLAALSIAYALGEGVGRLACISFGCCYGRPVSDCDPALSNVFKHYPFVFLGKTKKIAYESGLDGQKVVPIQAITAIVCIGVSLVALLLFLKGLSSWTLMLTIGATQVWRVASETLRADYRGNGSVSAYQAMAVVALVYCVLLTPFLPAHAAPPVDLKAGLATIWDPWVIISLQSVWVATFVSTGRSMVTGSSLSFHVLSDRV